MASKVRERIVTAAAESFHTLGFNACGVQTIVDKAGVPKGSFYNYFKAKELLAVEVVETYARQRTLDAIERSDREPMTRLREHFDQMGSRYEAFGFAHGCLIANLAAEVSEGSPLVRDAVAMALDDWTASIEAVIREGQGDGTMVRDLDPSRMARFLVNGWVGAVARMKLSNSRAPLDDFVAVAFSMLRADDGDAMPPRTRG